MGHQVAEQAMQTALLLKDGKDEAHDPLGLLIGIELVIAVGAPDLSHGGMMQQFPAPRLVAHAFHHPALHEGEFRFAHQTTQP
jgi:hypothetical protein